VSAYGENDMLLKPLAVDWPRNCTATNTAIAINATIKAYSIAVAPSCPPRRRSVASTRRLIWRIVSPPSSEPVVGGTCLTGQAGPTAPSYHDHRPKGQKVLMGR